MDKMVIRRRFIPSNEPRQLNCYYYLSIDSDDRVFVADRENARVIPLDSNLNLNRILFSTTEDEDFTTIQLIATKIVLRRRNEKVDRRRTFSNES